MIDTDVRNLLLADSAIAALVVDRIAPEVEQGTPHPLITYTAKIETELLFDGVSEFATATFDFAIEAASYLECRQLASLVRGVLNGYAGTLATCRIVPSKLTDETDAEELVEEGTDRPLWQCSQTYEMNFRNV